MLVVNAARVSFNKRKTVLDEADVKLIHYLAKNNHWTPFGHPQITLHLKVPIFVARQLMRSNVGIVYNEESRRYVDYMPKFFSVSEFRGKADNKKQGSTDSAIEDNERAIDIYKNATNAAVDAYNELLGLGVAPELARTVLPVSSYTQFFMTASLAALARVYNLRIDPHAQQEIRELAQLIGNIMQDLYPVSWSVLTNEASSI